MTDEELRQLIESNARAIQGNSESISRLEAKFEALVEQSQRTDAKVEALVKQSQRTDIKLDKLSDIVLGNYRNIVRVETATTNNEGAWLDVLERLNALERRLEAIESDRSE